LVVESIGEIYGGNI